MQRSELNLCVMETGRRLVRYLVLVIGVIGLLCGTTRFVAAAEGSSEDTNKVNVAGAAGTNVAAIPLAEVAAQAEAAFASLQSIEGNLTADQATVAIQQDLPVLTRESSARLEESSKTLGVQSLAGNAAPVEPGVARISRGVGGMETQLDEACHATG